MPCAKCIELERQLKEAWERILKIDEELQLATRLLVASRVANYVAEADA